MQYTITTTNPQKRVNVITRLVVGENGEILQHPNSIMRVSREYAAILVANGSHTTTSKSKLKKFLNQEAKLHRNKRAIKQFGTVGTKMTTDPHNGKSYARLNTMAFFSKHSFYSEDELHAFEAGDGVRLTGSCRIVTKFPGYE